MSGRHTYTSQRKKWGDFFSGIGLLLLANALMVIPMGIAFMVLYGNSSIEVAILCLFSIPWITNLGFLLYTGFRRHWMALGGLAAFSVLLFIDVVSPFNCWLPIGVT